MNEQILVSILNKLGLKAKNSVLWAHPHGEQNNVESTPLGSKEKRKYAARAIGDTFTIEFNDDFAMVETRDFAYTIKAVD